MMYFWWVRCGILDQADRSPGAIPVQTDLPEARYWVGLDRQRNQVAIIFCNQSCWRNRAGRGGWGHH